MIKFALRPNLIYPLQLILWSFIRSVERELIGQFYTSKFNLTYLPLMFFGEFIFGGGLFLYEYQYLKKKKENNKGVIPINFMSIHLIDNSNNLMQARDNKFKIILLIMFNAFFDFVEFVLSVEILPKFLNTSDSLENRLNGILILLQAIFYRYILSLPILRHQIFALIIISICLGLIIITEFIFQEINIFLPYVNFLMMFLALFYIQLFNSLLDLVDKYLFEYDYMNPFLCLMSEGFFGLIYTTVYFVFKNPFPEMLEFYEKTDNNWVLTLLLVLYSFLCGGQNTFRVVTNKIYSPMAATLSQYFLNPIYIIISLVFGEDFFSNGKRNYFYFGINFILSIVISLAGCVYNEFLILFFCKLQYETHDQIVNRALRVDDFTEMNVVDDDDDEEDS